MSGDFILNECSPFDFLGIERPTGSDPKEQLGLPEQGHVQKIVAPKNPHAKTEDGDIAVTKKGDVARYNSKEISDKMRERITLVRTLMMSSMSNKDIRTMIMHKFGIGERTAYDYVSAARQEQLEILNVAPEESLANAMNYWSDSLYRNRVRTMKIEKMLDELEDVYQKLLRRLLLLSTILEEKQPPEKIVALQQHQRQVQAALEGVEHYLNHNRSYASGLRREGTYYRSVLDRITVKGATQAHPNDSETQKMLDDPMKEPITDEECLAELKGLLEDPQVKAFLESGE